MSLSHLKTKVAESFKDSISSGNNYISIGQTLSFNANVATVHTATTNNEIDIWNSMISMKKLTYADTSLVIPAYYWTANTVYSAYDHTVPSNNLGSFYVVTSDYRVYKCLDNHKGAASLYEPNYTNTDRAQTFLDGYVWKYMYNLSDKDQLIFAVDTGFIPIHSLTVNDGSDQWAIQQNAIDGGVESVLVVSSGSNYSANASISVQGDGTGLILQPVILNGNVDRVIVISTGYGYTWVTPTITDVSGSGAVIKPIISPLGGHGANPVYEFNTSRVMISKSFNKNDGIVDNSFTQLALLDDVLTANSQPLTLSTYNVFTTVATSGSTSFQKNEYVYQGLNLDTALFSGVVVSFDSVSGLLYLNNIRGTPTAGSLVGQTSGAQRFISSVSPSEVTKYSGHILTFSDLNTAIVRDTNQTDTFNMVVSF